MATRESHTTLLEDVVAALRIAESEGLREHRRTVQRQAKNQKEYESSLNIFKLLEDDTHGD